MMFLPFLRKRSMESRAKGCDTLKFTHITFEDPTLTEIRDTEHENTARRVGGVGKYLAGRVLDQGICSVGMNVEILMEEAIVQVESRCRCSHHQYCRANSADVSAARVVGKDWNSSEPFWTSESRGKKLSPICATAQSISATKERIHSFFIHFWSNSEFWGLHRLVA